MSFYTPPPWRPPTPPGRPSIEIAPPGTPWPYCVKCQRYGAAVGTDGGARTLEAYVSVEHAKRLGWRNVKLVCPSCGKAPLASKVVHESKKGETQ